MNELKVPCEISYTLEQLNPYIKVCFYELINGKSLSAMNQRKHRAINSNNWDKFINIGVAVDLYKSCVLMNEKKAY